MPCFSACSAWSAFCAAIALLRGGVGHRAIERGTQVRRNPVERTPPHHDGHRGKHVLRLPARLHHFVELAREHRGRIVLGVDDARLDGHVQLAERNRCRHRPHRLGVHERRRRQHARRALQPAAPARALREHAAPAEMRARSAPSSPRALQQRVQAGTDRAVEHFRDMRIAVEQIAEIEHAEPGAVQIDEPAIIMSIAPILTCCTTSLSLPSWLFGK